MNAKVFSAANLSRFFAVLVGLALLTCCGGGSSTTPPSTGTPAASLSTSTLTFTSGVGIASAAQTVTVSNTGTATLTFTSITVSNAVFGQTNTCGTGIAAGTSCSISVTFTPTAAGAASGTLTITDNASGSPQTVSLSGTGTSVSLSTNTLTFSGVSVGTTSAAQSVTLNNGGSSALAISSITITGDFAQTNTCGSSVAAGGSCTISVTFSPQGSGPWTGTLTIADGAGTQTVALTGTNTVNNTAQITIGFGPNGPGTVTATSAPYFNGIFTSVTVCEPGSTTNCTTIPNILVDTDSVGLRVLTSALGSVSLTTITDTNGDPLNECYEYGSLNYTWGPVAMATVQIGGETASAEPGAAASSGVPIQLISTTSSPPLTTYVASLGQSYPTPCLSGGGSNLNTVASLGSNGILGIGLYPQDCAYYGGNSCTTDSNDTMYVLCPSTGCEAGNIPVTDQVWNPVAAFPADNNGESIQLPSISSSGAANNAVTGPYLTFGIGTQSNNAIPGSASVYEVDINDSFATATFNGIGYTSSNSGGSFIDSGSNALYVSDETTLGTTDCVIGSTDIGFYCPSSNLNLSLGLTGSGSNPASTTVSLPIENALTTLFPTGNAAFNDLGGPSCIPATGSPCSTTTDSWDLGLPFFFGRPIYLGIEGTSTTYPYGYWAF